jgi:hypothetical protein
MWATLLVEEIPRLIDFPKSTRASAVVWLVCKRRGIMTRLPLISICRVSRLPTRSVQLLVGITSEAEVVTVSVRNVVGDTRDLTDDHEIVFLGFFINSSVNRESIDKIVVDARALGAIYAGEFHHGSDGSFAILT